MSQVAQRSELGDQTVNEDRMLVKTLGDTTLLLIADGMGGHEAGELAAECVIEAAESTLQRNPALVERPDLLLTQIFDVAHNAVSNLRPELPEFRRPRTTAVGCVIRNDQAQWAHVGDSRLYLFRNGSELVRTTDHTTSYDLYKTGNMMRTDLRGFIRRSQLERSLGGDMPHVEVEHSGVHRLASGDTLLLCSDGVWSSIKGREMAKIVAARPIGEAVDLITVTALQRTNPDADNLTIAAYRVD